MGDLKNTKALVQFILENDQAARNSDYYLYFRVLNTIADKHRIDLEGISITDFLLNAEFTSLFPPFETVRRTRQKIQAETPSLSACETVREYRADNEEIFRQFARGM